MSLHNRMASEHEGSIETSSQTILQKKHLKCIELEVIHFTPPRPNVLVQVRLNQSFLFYFPGDTTVSLTHNQVSNTIPTAIYYAPTKAFSIVHRGKTTIKHSPTHKLYN